MTKISQYSTDVNITGNDKWIGSDAQNFLITKNFTPNNLADFFNGNNVIDIGTSIRYKYQTLLPGEAREQGTISFETEVGPQVNFSDITTFLIAKNTLKGNTVTQYLDFLVDGKVLISKASNINIFGYYKITSIEPWIPNTNFFVVVVEFVSGNGFIYEDLDYLISLVDKVEGGGGNQSLNQTLVIGNATDGEDIFLSDGDSILLDNGSKLKKGTTNAGNGGNNGIALKCSLDYEFKWEAGRMYIMQQDGIGIRETRYNFNVAPTVNDDDTKGYAIDSRWILDNGDLYVCTDATEGAAVWELQSNIPTLQEVTDEDNEILDNSVIFNNTANDFETSINKFGDGGISLISTINDTLTTIGAGSIYLGNIDGSDSAIITKDAILVNSVSYPFPNGSTSQLATLNDIPSVTGFVPYTGATSDVNLGEFGLLTGNLEFDNTPTNTPTTAGSMYYNDADGTLDLILKGGNVKLQIGQESVIRVVNKTATNVNLLEANYQAVRVTGAQGQRLKVDLAQATTDALSAETIGLVTETINNNQEGYITTSGLVRNINTTGSLQGETWADGDILYLSPTTAGNITKVKPVAPNHLVIIGYVIHSHVTQGSIFVKVDNGYELDELHNVKIVTATNNQALIYTSSTDIWENKTIIQDSITDGVTTVAPSQNAVFDALALRKRRIITDTTSVVVNTIGLTLAKTYELTAGTLSPSGFLDVYMFSSRTGASLVHSMSLYINTTNNFATATLITSMSTAGNFNPHLPAKLQYILKDNLLIGGLFSSTTGSNMPSSATRVSVACNNTSASVWLFVGITPAATQTITLEAVEILN